MVKWITLPLFQILFIASVHQVKAAVVINEILPHPEDKNNEWIELYNPTTETIYLTGFILDDIEGGSTPYALDGYEIAAFGFLVIDKATSGIGLNDTGDTVRLIDNLGNVINTLEYQSVDINVSLARIPDGSAQVVSSSPTQGKLNGSQATLTPPTTESIKQSGTIKLSEVMACPDENESEWIELVSQDTQPVSVNGWVIIDDAGNRITLDGSINVGEFKVIQIDKPMLNNSGDSIKVLGITGNIIDEASFTDCSKGTTFIFQSNGWVSTLGATPGKANLLVKVEPSKSESVKQSTHRVNEVQSETSAVDVSPTTLSITTLDLLPTVEASNSQALNASIAGIIHLASKSAVASDASNIEPYTHPSKLSTLPLITGFGLLSLGGYGLYSRYKNVTNR